MHWGKSILFSCKWVNQYNFHYTIFLASVTFLSDSFDSFSKTSKLRSFKIPENKFDKSKAPLGYLKKCVKNICILIFIQVFLLFM